MHIKISSFHINMYVIYIVNYILTGNRIDCVMVRVLSSSAVDCGLESNKFIFNEMMIRSALY
jgi:hypothetical protein